MGSPASARAANALIAPGGAVPGGLAGAEHRRQAHDGGAARDAGGTPPRRAAWTARRRRGRVEAGADRRRVDEPGVVARAGVEQHGGRAGVLADRAAGSSRARRGSGMPAKCRTASRPATRSRARRGRRRRPRRAPAPRRTGARGRRGATSAVTSCPRSASSVVARQPRKPVAPVTSSLMRGSPRRRARSGTARRSATARRARVPRRGPARATSATVSVSPATFAAATPRPGAASSRIRAASSRCTAPMVARPPSSTVSGSPAAARRRNLSTTVTESGRSWTTGRGRRRCPGASGPGRSRGGAPAS